jgi:hypothetical protein
VCVEGGVSRWLVVFLGVGVGVGAHNKGEEHKVISAGGAAADMIRLRRIRPQGMLLTGKQCPWGLGLAPGPVRHGRGGRRRKAVALPRLVQLWQCTAKKEATSGGNRKATGADAL